MPKSGKLKRLILGIFSVATVGVIGVEVVVLVVAKNKVEALAVTTNKSKAKVEDWGGYAEEVINRIKTSASLKEATDQVKACEKALIYSAVLLVIFLVIAYSNPFMFETLMTKTLPEDYLGNLQASQARWRQKGLSEAVIREETYLCMLNLLRAHLICQIQNLLSFQNRIH